MSITNYWFQLIWLLTVGMVLAISLPKKQEIVMGRIEERWQIAPAVLLVVPYILAATLRSDNFGDTYAYRSVFREAPSKIAALPLYLEGIKKDKGFSVLIVIIKALIGNSPILFFMFIATVQMLCMAFILSKNIVKNYWMSILFLLREQTICLGVIMVSDSFWQLHYHGRISITAKKKIYTTDSNYSIRSDISCVSIAYDPDHFYCAGKGME